LRTSRAGTIAAATNGHGSRNVATTVEANETNGAIAMVVSRARGVGSRTFAAMNKATANARMRSLGGMSTNWLSTTTATNARTAASVARRAPTRRNAPGSGGNSRSARSDQITCRLVS
jgi:hypothetical protein